VSEVICANEPENRVAADDITRVCFWLARLHAPGLHIEPAEQF
jgi:hypothetical protein